MSITRNGIITSMPSIKDVALAAGVSTATVSRVLANNSRVKEETRNRVLKAIDELRYRPVGGVPGSLLPVHPQVRAFLAQHGSAIRAAIR